MRDPVGAFRQIRNLFLTYLDTAFRIDNDELRTERHRLLEQPNVLCATPLIEPIPLYEASLPLEELLSGPDGELVLADFSSHQRKAFIDLALSGLIPSTGGPSGSATKKAEYPLYKHQLESLARGTKRGQPVIVTSGTGSGKTEAFLLPILATITKEAADWDRPAYSTRRWWQTKKDGTPWRSGFPGKGDPDRDPFFPQRAGEKRNAAVRALILYPMNALVEDQLVRLRRALDSDEARKSLDEHTQGNRIFFGRYTGATPVTGWNVSPVRALMETDDEIAREGARRERKLNELFEAMKDLQEGQTEAEEAAHAEATTSPHAHLKSAADSGSRRSMHYSLPFMFPSIDGTEMVSRWDMHAHPPDILITNTTMLSAMLAREVDDPIIQRTRDWIVNNDDAYFFLVLDELHLNRGAAGTEVAYLLRILLKRLGLADSKHAHKLRVLCSSASLPTEGALHEESLDYLWGMFGGLGTVKAPDQKPGARQDWANAIITGSQVLPVRLRDEKLDPAPFAAFLASHITSPEVDAPLPLLTPSHIEPLWRAMHKEFGFATDTPLDTCLRECIEQASAVLTSACAQVSDKLSLKIRATSIEQLGKRVFLGQGQLDENVEQAIRGLLLVRGYGDDLKSLYPGTKGHSAQPFRLHVFCRSLEGLFAALAPSNAKSHPFGPLAVERGSRCERTDLPLFELVYCEPCGEVFFGGRIDPQLASAGKIDLLPTEPRLEGLPDQAASYRFEDLSYETFRLFWPSEAPEDPDREDNGTWETTWLDPSTGHVEPDDPQRTNYLKLKMWRRDERLENPRHKRKAKDPGSHLPYACPKCGLSYKGRSTEHRLSPVRSFRTGLEKTTQLLTTELFTVLGGEGFGSRNAKANKPPKLISFSDSRQEAANAALQIERYHCRDVRRAVLVSVLASYLDDIPARKAALDAREQEMSASTELDDDMKDEALDEIKKERRLLDRELRTKTVALSRILEVEDSLKEGEVKPYLSRLVSLGLHPADETGVDKIRFTPAPKGPERPQPVEREWNELFTLKSNAVHWRTTNELKLEAPTIKGLQAKISAALLVDLTNVVHGRGYFALEDAGLGYATVPALATKVGATQPDPEREWCAAIIRLFGDRYRFSKSSHPYQSSEEHLSAWLAYDKPEAAKTLEKKIWRFADKAASVLRLTPEELLTKALRRLDENGHKGGRIANERISLQLVTPDTPFFRCAKCRRPHLHRGVGICTRCFEALPPTASGTAIELRQQSYLAIKAESGEFRLHCEELTGQTEDPARRQRYFRGVLPKDSFRVKDEIDLLTVTTTMEVGIDVGDLQGVVMANMPPQRFNYQQRVGRAGRRRQAFSIALTVCRARNHDLYYFRHPEKITGDDPPPPFLTKDLDVIAARLVRKEWMHEAFSSLRDDTRSNGEKYPTDTARSDIHGEYLPLELWPVWKDLVRQKLIKAEATRDDAIKWIAAFGGPDLTDGGSAKLSVDDILNAIDTLPAECRQDGLAHSLAEAGKLPMYGMPTRVRNLYIYTKDTVGTIEKSGKDAWRESSWVTIDRDADLAVFEFAPHSTLVKDKRKHLCVGLTPELNDFRRLFGRDENGKPVQLDVDVVGYGPAISAKYYLAECKACAAFVLEGEPKEVLCAGCNAPLLAETFRACIEPKAYRTDFNPKTDIEEGVRGRASRTANAILGPMVPAVAGTDNLLMCSRSGATIFRVNRGRVDPFAQGAPSDPGYSFSHNERKLYRKNLGTTSFKVFLPDQHWVADSPGQPAPGDEPSEQGVFLLSKKKTDSLILWPKTVSGELRLANVAGERRVTSVRAAALSATFLLANQAAFELDIDPDELEVMEPGVRPVDGEYVPFLQLADRLVNGAGYCERLTRTSESSKRALVDLLIEQILTGAKDTPAEDLFSPTHEKCSQACYLCLQRYSNQPYHGLLDWQLGLSFLEALWSTGFTAGALGPESTGAMVRWPRVAQKCAQAAAKIDGGEAALVGGLWTFSAPRSLGSSVRVVVMHPLWRADPDGFASPIMDAMSLLSDDGLLPMCADTFNLERRPSWVLETLRSSGEKSGWRY